MSISAPKLSGATSDISTPRRRILVTAGVTANSYIFQISSVTTVPKRTAERNPHYNRAGQCLLSGQFHLAVSRETTTHSSSTQSLKSRIGSEANDLTLSGVG